MNFRYIHIRALGVFGALFIASLQGVCQIEHGGLPFDYTDGIKAADVIYALPPPDQIEIEAALIGNNSGDSKALTFALERPLDLSPHSNGAWLDYKDYRVWRIHLISPEAQSLGVIFHAYKLNPGVRLFIYDPERKHILGSFNSENNKASGVFAVTHIPGEEVIVELQVPKGMDEYGDLQLGSLSHAFLPFGIEDINQCPGDHNCSEECEIDVNCSEGDDWQTINRSVVRIQTISQYCTGVMVNNTAYDEKPYVLNVEHCINTPSSAASAIVLFAYESPGCFGTDGSKSNSISGATLKAAGDSIDFSLIELSAAPPDSYNAYYAGWDLSDNPDAGVTTIHHPYGDVKKISFDFDNVSTPQSEDDIKASDLFDYKYFSFWWVHQWDVGTTEAGSSGAPLFNSHKRVIGILSGGRAKCGAKTGYDPETDRDIFDKGVNVNDYYTKLNVAWNYYGDTGPNLKEWLDPLNTGLTAVDGYNPVTNGMKPIINKGNLTLYPNPVQDKIYISGIDSSSGNIRYTIFDLTGRVILTGEQRADLPAEIFLPDLHPGIYTIKVSGIMMDESLRFIIN